MEDEQISVVEINPALVRPVLVSGAEREVTILVGMCAVVLWIAGKDFISLILAVVVWVSGMFLRREVAKTDSQGMKVFLNHIRFQDFYSAVE